jgi:hypothetical protein
MGVMEEDDNISDLMDYLGIPRTREAAIALEWMGDPPDPWTAEAEAMLPDDLQDWSQVQLKTMENSDARSS